MNKFRPIKAVAAFHCHRYGITLIWTVIFLLLFILLVGLVIDTARVYLASHQLQNASDAAALAGARIVRIYPRRDAREQARYISSKNSAQGDSVILDLNTDNADPNGDIILGHYYPNINPSLSSFVPTVPTDDEGSPKPNAVKVVAKRTEATHGPIPLVFGPLAKVNAANVSRDAIALATGGLGAGLIILSEDPGEKPAALTFGGNPEVYINSGSIQVNNPWQDWDNPINLGGSGVIVHADEINVVNKRDSTNGYIFDSATRLKVTTDQPRIPDPYADMPAPYPNPGQLPNYGSVETHITGNTVVTFQPGYYPQGFQIAGGNVTFKPGVYAVGGGNNGQSGLVINGGKVCAKRVMFYITTSTNGKYGQVKITGSDSDPIIITEIDSNDPGTDCNDNPLTYTQDISYLEQYNGMAIFQDRTNTADADIIGGNALNIKGTIYFPNNHVKLSGTSGSFGIQVIAHTMTIGSTGSNAKLIINYDGRNRTPASRSYLVK